MLCTVFCSGVEKLGRWGAVIPATFCLPSVPKKDTPTVVADLSTGHCCVFDLAPDRILFLLASVTGTGPPRRMTVPVEGDRATFGLTGFRFLSTRVMGVFNTIEVFHGNDRDCSWLAADESFVLSSSGPMMNVSTLSLNQ